MSKKMKSIITLFLAVVFVFSMAGIAFAAGNGKATSLHVHVDKRIDAVSVTFTDGTTVDLVKNGNGKGLDKSQP